MLPQDWIEHRRPDDRELLGWVRPDGDAFVAVDRLGRDVSGPVDWLEAEEALDARGIRWLADRWRLTLDDGTQRLVRLSEVTPERVVVVADDFGAASAVGSRPETFTLPFPAPATLGPVG